MSEVENEAVLSRGFSNSTKIRRHERKRGHSYLKSPPIGIFRVNLTNIPKRKERVIRSLPHFAERLTFNRKQAICDRNSANSVSPCALCLKRKRISSMKGIPLGFGFKPSGASRRSYCEYWWSNSIRVGLRSRYNLQRRMPSRDLALLPHKMTIQPMVGSIGIIMSSTLSIPSIIHAKGRHVPRSLSPPICSL